MPDFSSIEGFNGHLDKFVRDLADDTLSRIGKLAGRKAVEIANQEAAADLGADRKFTNWRPVADTRAVELRPGVVSIRPTPRGAGVWTVVTQGRNQGNAGGFAGPGVNRKTGATARTKSGGVRKVRARGSKRWNGVTQGKGTADSAVARMEPVVAEVVQREVVKTIGKFFD